MPADDWRNAVAKIVYGEEQGTCWLAFGNGYLVTAGHLFVPSELPDGESFEYDSASQESCDHMCATVLFPGHEGIAARLLCARADREYLDFAVLELDANDIPGGVAPLVLGPFEGGVATARVYGFGQDLSTTRVPATGKIDGWAESLEGSSWLKVTCGDAAQSGYSGAPIYDEARRCVVAMQIEASVAAVIGPWNIGVGVANSETIIAMPVRRMLEELRDHPTLRDFAVVRDSRRGDIDRTYTNGFSLAHLYDMVGRKDEVEDILRLLRERKAVLVYGEGGIGKTEVCREVIQRCGRCELVAVDLAEVDTYAKFLSQLKNALGISAGGEGQSDEAVRRMVLAKIEGLPTHDLVVYLDNLEDVLSENVPKKDRHAVAQFVSELAGNTDAMVLMSSRHTLRLGELVSNYLIDILDLGAATDLFCSIWFNGGGSVPADLRAEIAEFVENELCCFPLSIVLAASQRHLDFGLLKARWNRNKGRVRIDSLHNTRHESLVTALSLSYEEVSNEPLCLRIWELFTLFPATVPCDTIVSVLASGQEGCEEEDVEDALERMSSLSIVRWRCQDESGGRGTIWYDMLQPLRQMIGLLPQSRAEEERLRKRREEAVDLLAQYNSANMPSRNRSVIKNDSERQGFVMAHFRDILFFMDVLCDPTVASDAATLERLHNGFADCYQWDPVASYQTLSNMQSVRSIPKRFKASIILSFSDLAVINGDFKKAGILYKKAKRIYGKTARQEAYNGLASTLIAQGDLAIIIGDFEGADNFGKQAGNIYKQAGNIFYERGADRDFADTLRARGDIAALKRDFDGASTLYKKAEGIYRKVGADCDLYLASILLAQGGLEAIKGEYKRADDFYKNARDIFRNTGFDLGIANTLLVRGDLKVIIGDSKTADDFYESAYDIFRRIGDDLGLANTLRARGKLAAINGDSDGAGTLYKQAEDKYRTVGTKLDFASAQRVRGKLVARVGGLARAGSICAGAKAICRLMCYDLGLNNGFCAGAKAISHRVGYDLGLANTLQARGTIARLYGLCVAAEVIFTRAGFNLGFADTLLARGDLSAHIGDTEKARRLYTKAERLYRRVGYDLGLANALQARGDLFQQTAEYGRAVVVYKSALPLYEKVQDVMGEGYTLSELAYCYAKLIGDQLAVGESQSDLRKELFECLDDALRLMEQMPFDDVRDYMKMKMDSAIAVLSDPQANLRRS